MKIRSGVASRSCNFDEAEPKTRELSRASFINEATSTRNKYCALAL